MNIISNNTEIAVIFERIDIPEMATIFCPIDVVIGHGDKKTKKFITEDGEEFPYMLSNVEKYTFGLRRKVGSINKYYQKKTLNELLDTHLNGLSQFIYYFSSNSDDANDIEFIMEDAEENMYVIEDRDFESFKKSKVIKEKPKETVKVEVNSKNLINEVKKKIIGQDDAIEDIVSIIWQNSKSDRKQNILLTGPTGVGKTEIIRIIANKLNIPMIIANAASMTQSGYIGTSVDDVLSDLLAKCDNDVRKAEQSIIVIDEIDKLAHNKFSLNDIATSGVQDELLKLVEDGTYTINVSKNYNITINTKNITFIAIGAFSELLKEKRENKQQNKIGFGNNNVSFKEITSHLTTDELTKYGLKQELIGRFTNVIELNPLTKENLIQIMKNPNEDLIKHKIKLLNSLGVNVEIKDSVYDKLANIAIKKNIGARGLIGEVDNLFIKAITEVSQNDDIYESLTIDENTIDNPKNYTLIRKKDGNK